MLVDENEMPRPQADQSSEGHFGAASGVQFGFLDKWMPPKKTAYLAFDDLVRADDDLWDVRVETRRGRGGGGDGREGLMWAL